MMRGRQAIDSWSARLSYRACRFRDRRGELDDDSSLSRDDQATDRRLPKVAAYRRGWIPPPDFG
jgi:hypothetical protein